MSDKERMRRKTAQMVMILSWRYKKRDPFSFSLSLALTLGWAVFRSRVYMHHAKVRGVTFEGRQRVLKILSRFPEERVSLRILHEKDNVYDENAMKIFVIIDGSYRACVGYLRKETARYVAPQIDNGKRCIAFYEGVTGGYGRKWGINLCYALL
jgi:hypothetical protein